MSQEVNLRIWFTEKSPNFALISKFKLMVVHLGGSKITADSECSHEIKRHLLLGRKSMTNLDSILKSRDMTLPTRSI